MTDIAWRPGTWDENIWRSVIEHDEYGIAQIPLTADDVVLDVGAHIGAFTYLALDRGAGHVLAVECDPQNAQFWQHNIHVACGAVDRAALLTAAAWRSDRFCPHVHYAGVGTNSGGGNTLGNDGLKVAAFPLEDLIYLAAGMGPAHRVRLMKIDAEGAEWPMLLTTSLDGVAEIVGEYHTIEDLSAWPAASVPGYTTCDAQLLEVTLRGKGFEVQTMLTGGGLGIFHAWRRG